MRNAAQIAPEDTFAEEGDPSLDGRMFRRCLGQYGTGVAIITTVVEGRRAAITVNSFASVSLDPPLVLWSVARSSRGHNAFTSGAPFAVNVLAAKQVAVSRHFSSRVEDKFAEADWTPGLFDLPLIDGCLASFECETHATLDGGDHTIVLGRVRRAKRSEGEPLLFTQGQYGVATPHPEASPTPEAGAAPASGATVDDTIIGQIFEAHNLLSASFDAHRQAEGVQLATARVLACLYDRPGLGIEALADATLLGRRDAEDAIATLREREAVAPSGQGWALTESGRALREAVRARWRAFQRDQIADIPADDLRRTIGVLSTIISRNGISRNGGAR